ncbi:MAG TPA: hypothetical protein VNJ03_14965 [Vicinamibacterales bacterium]|nr:hypothetical protein [Vicinamibacterales bacterium]
MPGKYGAGSFSVLQIGGISMLTAKLKGASWKIEVPQESTDGLGDAWSEMSPTGAVIGTFSQEGAYFDDTASRMHSALKSGVPASRVGVVAYAGNTIGSAMVGFSGMLNTAYDVIASMGGLSKANAAYAVSGSVEPGVILQPLEEKSANWTGTSVDYGAATTGGGAGYLSVSQFNMTNAIVKVRHSADNVTFADLVTFTTVTASPTAERVAVTGTVNRYLMSTGTVTGVGTISLVSGFARTV